MPIVPTVQGRQVSSNPLPSNGPNLQYTPDNFGAGLAKVGEQYAGAFAQLKSKADLAQAQDALLQFQGHAEDQFSNLQNLQGKNVIGQGDATVTNIRSKAEELASSLPDGTSRQVFMQQANQLGLQYKRQAINYEHGQIQQYEANQFSALQQNVVSSAQSQYGDPDAFTATVKTGFDAIDQFADAHGWSDEQRSAAKVKLKEQSADGALASAASQNTMDFLASNGEPGDTVEGAKKVSLSPYGGSPETTKGMKSQGNIDIFNRPKVKNADGTISTVRTISINNGEGEVLIPTVSDDGRIMTNDEAVKQYEKTGKNFGVFDTPEDATAYAQELHNQQDEYYARGDKGGARGIRNNNPGNIEAGNTPWEGQAGSDGRFAKFITPEHGIRALGKNLLSYADKGYDTVTEIVNRWAPASDGNNTDAYIKSLCSRLGVKPDDQLNMSDISTLKSLCAGIVQHENGKLPYSDEQLNTGVQAALGLTALETPKRYTGNAAFDAASPQQQAAYLRQAKSMQEQARTQARAQLTDVVQDATASYLKGVEYPNAPTEGQFIQAYGYREGRQRYEDLSNMRVAGQYIGSFRNMPTASITQYVSALKSQLGQGEGFAGRAAAFDHVETAANRVISMRESDPYQAAVDMGAFKPIASSNPQDITAEVKNRFASTDRLKSLGINAPMLSKQEASSLSDMVRGSTNVDQSINLLQSFGRSLPPQALRSVAGSIAPNSAATAYASLLLAPEDNQYNNKQPTIAYSQFVGYKPTMDKYEATKAILLGDQLVNPSESQKKAGIQPVALPSDDKLRQEFDTAVGTAFQHNPQARQMAYGVFKSAYAGLAYTSKDTDDLSTKSVNSDLAEKAVQYATGGVYQGFNGGDVVMPFGMDKSTFKDRYNSAARDALSGAGLNPGAIGNFRPVNVGDNQYRLVAGSGRWAVDPRTGNPVVVRVQ